MTFPLKVFGARTVIKVDEKETTTLGGIILTARDEEQSNTGVIVAVGDGQRLPNGTVLPMNVFVGDKVVFNPMNGAPVEVEGEEGEFVVLNEAHILAVVE